MNHWTIRTAALLTAAGLTHVRTTPNWSPESQPPMLFLTLFRKGGQ